MDKILQKEIEKKTGIKILPGSAPELVIQRVPIDIPLIDNLIGGGFPKGRITLLAGHYSTCKTFLCQKLIKSVQALGGKCVYIDAEKAFDPAWFQKTGVNIDELYVIQPDTGEQALDVAVFFLKQEFDLVILDSIATLLPNVEEEESVEKSTIGLLARLVNKGLRKMTGALSNKSILVLINQLRESIGGYGLNESLPGGKGQESHASIIVRFRKGAKLEENGNIVGYNVHCVQHKNKVGGVPLQAIDLPFRFDGTLDLLTGMIEIAMDKGIILRKGGWFYLYDGKYHGSMGIKTALQDNPELMKRFEDDLGSSINGIIMEESPSEDED